ncbi:MAG: hypothetical protein HQM14_16440 [SAR324 cluster bacterium]|nr:hypothetical protein [SAR324 cluster bacterium]
MSIFLKNNYPYLVGGFAVFTILAFLQLFELALGVMAVLPLFLLLGIAFRDHSLEVRLLSIVYLTGQIICWVLAFLGCIYIIPLLDHPYIIPAFNLPIRHPMVTMILINLITWGAVFGSLLAFPPRNRKTKPPLFPALPENLILKGIGITGIIFIIFLISHYYSGSLSARLLVGNRLPIGSGLYWLSGLGILPYLFFFFLGAHLNFPLFSLINLIRAVILLICMFLVSLAGGRDYSLVIFLFFLGGTLYSKVSLKTMILLVAGTIPLLLALFIVIGAVRTPDFMKADVDQRLKYIVETPLGKTGKNWKFHVSRLISRIGNDLSGQVVIDNVVESQKFVGFVNFERLSMIFLPKILIGEKLPADDSLERLQKGHGLPPNWNPPLSFMADSFERGGYLITFLASFLTSLWLTSVGRLLHKYSPPLFRAMLLVAFASVCFKIFAFPLIETIRQTSYVFVKQTILIGAILSIIYFLPTPRAQTT